MPWPILPVRSERELIRKHHESVWVQWWCYSTAEAYSSNPGHLQSRTHPRTARKYWSIMYTYLSPLSSDITTLAETQRWYTVYWTEQIESTHTQSANHAHPLRPRTTSVSITAFTPVMLSGRCTKHTQSTWITCSYSYSSTETITFNLALFMYFIKGHTCTLRDVDTDRRAAWTLIFQI